MFWVFIRSASLRPQHMFLSTHNICFYGELEKIIPELSSSRLGYECLLCAGPHCLYMLQMSIFFWTGSYMCRFSEWLTFFISCLFLVCLIRNNCLLLILKSSNVLTLLYRWGSFLAKFPENNVVVRKPRYMELPDKEAFDSSDISVNAQNFSENLDTQKNLYGNSKNHISLFSQQEHTFQYLEDLLTLALLNPDIPCLCKQCRSRSAGFWGSQLIWICTVCHYVNLYQQSGSSNQIGWKLEVGVAS